MKKSELLIKRLAEETIYSAKGHFKSSDVRGNLINFTIWTCAVLSVLGLVIEGNLINKWFSAIGLIGSIGLLIWNEGESKDYRTKHKEIAELYLSIHKELRDLYFMDKGNKEKLKEISDRIKLLDQSKKPNISILARKLSQLAIEKNKETDNWYKYE
ncbi:MAG: hypothetical protein N4A35_01690 [Flavobacteriales bacterium]|jgi:hypothetical protein|nr:hypothetical protein [Flavobacteriales bacterium]